MLEPSALARRCEFLRDTRNPSKWHRCVMAPLSANDKMIILSYVNEKAVEEIDFDEEEGERGMLVARLRPPGTLDWLPSDEKRAQAIAARGQWPFDVLHTDGDQEDLDEAQTRAALDALEQCTSKRKAPCSTPSSSKAPSQPKKPKLDQVDVAPAAESHPDDGVGATGRPGRKSADRAKERFETEDLVWARVKGWHWWPGVITDVAGSKYSVTLFGTAAPCDVFNENDLKTWSDRHPCDKSGEIKKLKNTSHCVYSQADQMEYKTAVEEAMKLAEEYQMHIETMQCGICGGGDDDSRMIICDGCDIGYHIYCVTPLLSTIPEGDWHCTGCACTTLTVPPAAVTKLVTAAIAKVLSMYQWPPLPHIRLVPAEPDDLVEVLEDDAWRSGIVLDRREAKGTRRTYVALDEPQPPAGAWRYVCKENETIHSIVIASYSDQAVAAAVLEVILEYQEDVHALHPMLATYLQLIPSSDLNLTGKLRAYSCIMLPEFYQASYDETLEDIANRFGRPPAATRQLNERRTKSTYIMDGIVLLPPSMPNARAPVPSGPTASRFAPTQLQLANAQARAANLVAGSRVWVETHCEIDGEHNKWRPATVAHFNADGDSIILTKVAGDRSWVEPYVTLSSEGVEWVRDVPWPHAKHQSDPFGVAGSGLFIPPFATWFEVRAFKSQQMRSTVRTRPAPPPLTWLDLLPSTSEVEVLFDGSWQLARIDSPKKMASGHFTVDLLDPKTREVFEYLICDALRLRPYETHKKLQRLPNRKRITEGTPDAEDDPSIEKCRELDHCYIHQRCWRGFEHPGNCKLHARPSTSTLQGEDGVHHDSDKEAAAEEGQPVQAAREPPEGAPTGAPATSQCPWCHQAFKRLKTHMPHCPRMPAVSEDDEEELRQVQQEDDEVASDEAATSEVEKNSGEEADSIGLSDGGDERSLTESHYIPSWAKGVVKTIKDLKQTQPELLQGAKDVLEERFGHVEWFKALVPGLLGLSKFGKVANNYRPGNSKPLADHQAGDSQHNNLGLALIVQGEEVIAAACTCIVRASSRSKLIALEVLLFAVKASYEKQGVATRLVNEIFRHCRACEIPEVMILSEKRIEHPRNWWVLKGGFELQGRPNQAFGHLDGLMKHMGLNELPQSFMLPWTIFKDGAEERRNHALACKRAMQQGIASTESAVSASNSLTILVAPVSEWLVLNDVAADAPLPPTSAGATSKRPMIAVSTNQKRSKTIKQSACASCEEEEDEAGAADGEVDDAANGAVHGPLGQEGEEDEAGAADGEVDDAANGAVHGPLGQEGEEDEAGAADGEVGDAANGAVHGPLGQEGEAEALCVAPRAAAQAANDDEEAATPVAAVRRPTLQPNRVFPGRRTALRKMRIMEAFAGSGRLATQCCKSLGADVLIIERDHKAPDYNDVLTQPRVGAPPGEAAAQMRQAAANSKATVYFDRCMCRDIKPEDLPTLDYAHFSPQCTSVSRAAGSAHPRKETDIPVAFLGYDDCCKEYNSDLQWILDVCQNQRRRSGNSDFKFTVEAPVGNAQKLIHFKMMQVPVDHGGIGATQVELTYCKFGMEYEKPTFFWTNIESLIKELENGEKICSEETPCKVGPACHKQLGRDAGPTTDAARFPPDLVTFLQYHVDKACSKRRNDSVPA
jgi:hypothetical protein